MPFFKNTSSYTCDTFTITVTGVATLEDRTEVLYFFLGTRGVELYDAFWSRADETLSLSGLELEYIDQNSFHKMCSELEGYHAEIEFDTIPIACV